MTTQDITRDPLTGLVNRRAFERHLRVARISAYAGSTRHALCYLDLDQFRAVNHACGHVAGDQMLAGVAGCIRDSVGDLGVVARVGGDEFGILLKDCPIERAREIADRIVREVADYRFTWNGKVFSVGVSIGLVELSHDSGLVFPEICAADAACNLAKAQGNRVKVYSGREEVAALRRDQMHRLQFLKRLIDEGHLALGTRPFGLMHPPGNGDSNLEVVLRYKYEGGPTPAALILLEAESDGHMPIVDSWVVKTSLEMLGSGEFALPAGRRLVIPLSRQSLGEEDLLEFVVNCLDRSGVAPDRVCFEVAEDLIIPNANCARRFIAVMHSMGCQFGLCGVGRGPASFERMSGVQFAYLKFDGDLIRNQASDREQRDTVTAMINRARTLGFQVVASKVDDPGAVEDVVAVEIDWEVEGQKVLHLMVNADGSIHRQGDGTPSGVSCYLDTGRSEESLLRKLLEGLDPELLTTGGVMVLEPIVGKLCKLTIRFGYRDVGGNAFEVWFGSDSMGPHPSITALVRQAIEQTNEWYLPQRPCPHGGD